MPGAAFALEVATPERAILTTTATSVVLRSSEGDLTVLNGHAALVTDVVAGTVRVDQQDGTTVTVCVHGGYLRVDTVREDEAAGAPVGTRVTVLAGVAEDASSIDVDRAERAREAAQVRLAELGQAGASTVRPSESEAAPGEEAGAEARALEDERLAVQAALSRAETRLAVASGLKTRP